MLLFADYETFYSTTFTLKKMTPAEYILDPQFVAHGLAVQIGEKGRRGWVNGPDIPGLFSDLQKHREQGGKVTMVTYNALFDMCITAWRYGFVPDLMIDVLGMVRATFGPALRRASLAHVAEFLKLPQGLKGNALGKVMGMNVATIKQWGLWDEYVAYAKQDVNLMVGIYRHIMPQFPMRELKVMDLVLRCAVQPQFKFDKARLEQHLKNTQAKKADLLAACGLHYDENGKVPELMSAPKFKALLEEQGVLVEDKVSATGRLVPALAKTDTFMQNLLEDENETVAALAAARLGHKSTIEETRTQRFISIASLPSAPGYKGGSAPIPLRYGAAHTHRLGGEWLLNFQNLSAGRNGGTKDLRQSLIVEDDEEVVTADEAQIEARLSAYIAKERTLLREFTEKLDPYGQLGAAIFGLPAPVKGDKAWRKVLHPVEGFIGKTGILGLGYGAGEEKFHTMVNSMARVALDPAQLETFSFDRDMSVKSVRMYRERYHRMPHIWRFLQTSGMKALIGEDVSCVLPPVVIRRGVIWGPNGQRMIYPNMEIDPVSQEWTYQAGNMRHKIYGAKLLENITQWLARVIVMDAAVRIEDTYGLRFALQAHDELVFVVKKDKVTWAKGVIKHEMERRPGWAPELPLEVDVNSGPNYGDAK